MFRQSLILLMVGGGSIEYEGFNERKNTYFWLLVVCGCKRNFAKIKIR